MALFKNISEIQAFMAVNITAVFETILPYINQAENKFIKNILGEDLLKELQDFFDIGSMPDEYEALLEKVQMPLINFAYYLSVSNLNLQITGSGFVVTQTQNQAPASRYRTDDLKADLQKAAYDGIEILLDFLEENKEDYTLWISSDAYTEHYRFFVKDALDFHCEVNIDKSRRKFLEMRQSMKNIETLQIEPVISKALADAIKAEIKLDTVSVANQKILTHLKSACANLTAAKEIDPKFEEIGQHYLSEVKLLLDAAPDDYPIYKASDCYDEDKTTNNLYENDEDSHLFVMGGPR